MINLCKIWKPFKIGFTFDLDGEIKKNAFSKIN